MSNEVTVPAYKTKLGNSTAKGILILLADHSNSSGFSFPSIETIADRAELSKRQVLRVIQVFQEIGLVERKKVKGQNYKHSFQINLSLLETDLKSKFKAAFKSAQKKSVSETPSADTGKNVSATPKDVSETQKSVSETLPPDPLLGRTINEPSGNLLPKDKPSVLSDSPDDAPGEEPPKEDPPKQEFTKTHLFRLDFDKYFQYKNGAPAPWDKKEASRLSNWIKANPTITQEQWLTILRNRARSPVGHAKPLSVWVGVALGWLQGPADDWGKAIKIGATNGNVPTGKADRNLEILQRSLNRGKRQSGADEDGMFSTSGDGRNDARKLLPSAKGS